MLSEAAQRVFFFVARAAMLTSHATTLHDVVRNRGTNMQGKIALEEHFAIEPTLGDSQLFGSHVWKDLSHRLLDIQETRLGEMDKYGIEMMILSLNAPAIQAIPDSRKSVTSRSRQTMYSLARCANDRTGLPPSPHSRCRIPDRRDRRTWTRCVKELGMVGALVNGFSQAGMPNTILYYDLPGYRPFWRAVEAARRAVLSASAQSTAELDKVLRGPQLDARPELGLCCRRRPSTLCG